MKKSLLNNQGFTLLELLISVSIFAFMSALLLAKYGTFSSTVLVTNIAYDVALTVRQAQSFGLNVKQSEVTCVNGSLNDNFQCSYGAHFSSKATITPAERTQFSIFADSGGTVNTYDATDGIVNTYIIKRGGYVSSLCYGASASDCGDTPTNPLANTLDIIYKRPNPNAIITANGSTGTTYTYAEIRLRTPDGSTKKVIARKSGQISIEN